MAEDAAIGTYSLDVCLEEGVFHFFSLVCPG